MSCPRLIWGFELLWWNLAMWYGRNTLQNDRASPRVPDAIVQGAVGVVLCMVLWHYNLANTT